MLKKASWFACLMVLAISCLDEPDCFRLNNNFAGISFKKMFDGQPDTVALIGVQASGTDSIFDEYVLASQVYLQLNYFTEQTSFTIETLEAGIKQVVLGYDVRTQFVSEDCGARYVLSNLQLLSANYDSIRLIDGTPGASQAGANIEVYRCPITNRMELSFKQLQASTSVTAARKIESLTNGNGTPIYLDTTLSTVYLPLNPSGSSDLFTVNFGDQTTKAFSLTYITTPRTFFGLCGAQRLLHDLKITSDDFDSLSVITDSIQDPPVTNLIAYRCPETNLMQVYFRKNGSPVRNDTINVKTIKDQSGKIIYANQKLTYAVLPLDASTNSSTFTFELQTTTKTLTVNYTRTPQTLFDACDTANGGQQDILFSDLVATSTFTQANVLPTADSVRFPAITNVQIIQ